MSICDLHLLYQNWRKDIEVQRLRQLFWQLRAGYFKTLPANLPLSIHDL